MQLKFYGERNFEEKMFIFSLSLLQNKEKQGAILHDQDRSGQGG